MRLSFRVYLSRALLRVGRTVNNMAQTSSENSSGCGAKCSPCMAAATAAAGGPTGRRLVLPAMGMFLMPLVLACGAAMLAGPGPTAQLAAAVGGLVLGAAAAAGVARILRRHAPATADESLQESHER